MSHINTHLAKGKLIRQVRPHSNHDLHHHDARISDVIRGGQDGL